MMKSEQGGSPWTNAGATCARGASIATVAVVRHISSRGVGLQTRERVLPAGVVVAR